MITKAIATADTIPPTTSTRIATRCDCARPARARAWCSVGLLHLLARLPEEEVGRDGRAEHGDECCQPCGAAREVRDEQAVHDRSPVDVDRQENDRIREQRQREPPQHARVPVVAEHDREGDHAAREHDDQSRGRQTRHELRGCSHGADVGRDVERVRDHRDQHRAEQDRAPEPGAGSASPDRGPVASPRRAASSWTAAAIGATDERRPEQRVSEPGADLRVGPDARRVVVGRTRDDPRTEPTEVAVAAEPAPTTMVFVREPVPNALGHAHSVSRTLCEPGGEDR